MNESFELYTLEVHVIGDPVTFVCAHHEGKNLLVHGENIKVLTPDATFSMYALSAILPILPAKQRRTEPADWITTDSEIACPDPHCGARFMIRRLNTSVFEHSEVTKVPMDT